MDKSWNWIFGSDSDVYFEDCLYFVDVVVRYFILMIYIDIIIVDWEIMGNDVINFLKNEYWCMVCIYKYKVISIVFVFCYFGI